MRHILFVAMLGILLSSCSPYGYPSVTANSIEDIRWQSDDSTYEFTQAPLLNCERVASCDAMGESPDQYQVGEETIYVWTYNYFAGFRGNSTLFWVVVYRPQEDTWDGIGFEYDQEGWKVGAYGGTIYIKTVPCPIWYTSYVGSLPPTAVGVSDEPWAIIVSPIDADNFNYAFVPNYWEEE